MSRIADEADLPVLRGRLDAHRQFTIRVAAPQKLACRFEEHNADIALNQIIKVAIVRLLGMSRSAENQRRLRELSFSFAEVRSISVKDLPWDKVIIDRTNASWGSLLSLAQLLLGNRFQTVSMGGNAGFSLLFEMNVLFEEFVGRVLFRGLKSSGLEVRLQGPVNHALIDEGGFRRFKTKPDIVVFHRGVPVVIIDTKWKRLTGKLDDPKRGVGQSDVYQMMAYAQVYRCSRLVLLYPHHQQMEAAEGPLETHRVLNTSDTKLTIMSVSLSNLDSIAHRLSQMIMRQLDGLSSLNTAA